MTRDPSGTQGSTPPKPIQLDGRMLEGGGQLVRIAIALSALTGQSIQINHVRGNRRGKKGLKGSHLAAIKFLAELTGASVSGAELGSSTLTFHPQPCSSRVAVRSHVDIQQTTAGSVFLVFQALYPYLLHAGETDPITLTITGGTNVSCSPSFDYVAQVLVPNLARLGLPPLTVCLDRRGWATGPVSLGKVTIRVDPLRRRDSSSNDNDNDDDDDDDDGLISQFPPIGLAQYRRGSVTQIDVTVLAPDEAPPARWRGQRGNGRVNAGGRRRGPDWGSDRCDDTGSIRQCVEQEMLIQLRRGLRRLPRGIFHGQGSPIAGNGDGEETDDVPIRVHTTEATGHFSHLYVLIVAHTSTGFRVGHDALYCGAKAERRGRQSRGEDRHAAGAMVVAARELAKDCVAGFLQELYDPRLQGSTLDGVGGRQPCVDEHLRDQMVIFEALGRAQERQSVDKEDERYWSLHTRTAQWVCEEILQQHSGANVHG
ncbi:RNA 3'-terminal phosphate cyclase domain-containing protein [Aspergillus ambiguus]|uniref:putative RNA 3'-terminal phosphate cyclase n=1 Tax=Aspergillus ambiguus TaxID=176160 RepID=UPI003CCDEE57